MLHSSDALPLNLWNYTKATVSADQKLGIYVSQADAAELYFTGIFYLFPLEYGAALPPVQAGVFDTCPLTQHRWFSCFADVEK